MRKKRRKKSKKMEKLKMIKNDEFYVKLINKIQKIKPVIE